MTGLLLELRARIGAAALPLVERWDSDVAPVGRLDPGCSPRPVFVMLSPSARDRYDVTFEPGPGSFEARDVDGVERLVRLHRGWRKAGPPAASAA